MRCNNCTTELWGHPSVCPVCGTPTGTTRAPRSQGTGTLRPNRPQPSAAPESSSFFNASDLVDPAVLEEIGAAPAQPRQNGAHRHKEGQRSTPAAPPAGGGGFLNAADLFDADIFDQAAPAAAPEPAAGQINAADLFDPDVLGFPEQEAAPGGPALFNASELLDEDLRGDHLGQGWEGPPTFPEEDDWLNNPRAQQRAPTGAPLPPVAPPLFNLQPLAPEAPPPRPARPGARHPARQAPIYAPDPLDIDDLDPAMERGWRIVPPATPQVGFPAGARPGHQRRPPPPKPSTARRLTGTLGKAAALVLVLGIIGVAIQVGFVRCQQLDCWQSLLSGQSSALPTLTPIPGFASYQDPQIGVVLEYPKGWQRVASHRDSDKGYVSDRFAVSSYAWIEIGSSPQYSGWTADQINAATISFLRASPTVTSVQTWVPATSTTHIDGQDWSIEDAAFSLQDGTNLQLSTLALIYNGRGYVIFYQSHQEEFTHFSSQYFEPMLLSFRFLNR